MQLLNQRWGEDSVLAEWVKKWLRKPHLSFEVASQNSDCAWLSIQKIFLLLWLALYHLLSQTNQFSHTDVLFNRSSWHADSPCMCRWVVSQLCQCKCSVLQISMFYFCLKMLSAYIYNCYIFVFSTFCLWMSKSALLFYESGLAYQCIAELGVVLFSEHLLLFFIAAH